MPRSMSSGDAMRSVLASLDAGLDQSLQEEDGDQNDQRRKVEPPEVWQHRTDAGIDRFKDAVRPSQICATRGWRRFST